MESNEEMVYTKENKVKIWNLSLFQKVDENYKYTLNNKFSLTNKHKAPVAQLDRALGYGPGGSGFNS